MADTTHVTPPGDDRDEEQAAQAPPVDDEEDPAARAARDLEVANDFAPPRPGYPDY